MGDSSFASGGRDSLTFSEPEVVRQALEETLSSPDFAGRNLHWVSQMRGWMQSLWEHLMLAYARATSGMDITVDDSILGWGAGLTLIGLAIFVFLVLRRVRGAFVREIVPALGGMERVPEESYSSLRRKAARYLARGLPFEAIRAAYLAGLRLLWERGFLPNSTARTDREFLAALGSHPARADFGALSALFSKYRYGLYRAEEEEARAALQMLNALQSCVHEHRFTVGSSLEQRLSGGQAQGE